MKNKITSILVLILTFALSLGFYPSFTFAEDAQQVTAPVPAETPAEEEPLIEFEGAEFSYGTVKSISGDQLVVSEYDYENDKDIDVTYSVNAETTYEGVQSLVEIAAGDSVDIDYKIEGHKKTAVAVAVEKGGEDEELSLTADELTTAPEAQSADQSTVPAT